VAEKAFAVPKAQGPRSIAQWKQFFFDREAVAKAAGRGGVKALSRFGAIVRRTAQTSMRYRKGVSPAGSPPSAHKSKRLASLKKLGRAKHNGAMLRELLFFAFDPATKSVVVGPVGFKSTRGTPVPHLHEFGGTRQAGKGEVMAVKGKGKRAGLELVKIAGKTLRYPARPYMRPALMKTVHKFAAQFAGVVHSGGG
jgi:hypothetical protein